MRGAVGTCALGSALLRVAPRTAHRRPPELNFVPDEVEVGPILRLREEHHQQVSNWHNRFYLPGMASFKQALASVYDSYRTEDTSVSLVDACKVLKLEAVSVRRNKDLMASPPR